MFPPLLITDFGRRPKFFGGFFKGFYWFSSLEKQITEPSESIETPKWSFLERNRYWYYHKSIRPMIFYLQKHISQRIEIHKYHRWHRVTIGLPDQLDVSKLRVDSILWLVNSRSPRPTDHSPSHLKPQAAGVLYVIVLQNWNKRWAFIFSDRKSIGFLSSSLLLTSTGYTGLLRGL